MSVQAVKDSFYATLRNRVAANNPGRTAVIRGVVRPGVLVVENELPGATIDGISIADTFCLRWTTLRVDALGMVAAGCEIRYATDGSESAAGMDRGRALTAMDAELEAAVGAYPQFAPAQAITETPGDSTSPGTAPGTSNTTSTATGTNIFWSDVIFAPSVLRGERLERTATVEVFGYE